MHHLSRIQCLNHNRSGEAFVTSAARSALVVPLLRMAAVGDDVFTGDTALAREALKEIDHPEFKILLLICRRRADTQNK